MPSGKLWNQLLSGLGVVLAGALAEFVRRYLEVKDVAFAKAEQCGSIQRALDILEASCGQ
jgi:hypothetical protein